MIVELRHLPALMKSWLEPLPEHDPELYEELAQSLVVERSAPAMGTLPQMPAGVAQVLETLDLAGKEIGAFRFAAAPGRTAVEQISAFDRKLRGEFDISGDALFVGEFGAAVLVALPDGLWMMYAEAGDDRLKALATSFGDFLLVQANAYDAYKTLIVERSDEKAYRTQMQRCAAEPSFKGVDVEAVFLQQLQS